MDILMCMICKHEWRFNGQDDRCPHCGSVLVRPKE